MEPVVPSLFVKTDVVRLHKRPKHGENSVDGVVFAKSVRQTMFAIAFVTQEALHGNKNTQRELPILLPSSFQGNVRGKDVSRHR